jgi:hypothetical protein
LLFITRLTINIKKHYDLNQTNWRLSMIVNNMDVAGIIRRLRRFRVETIKSASSGLAAVSEADFTRAKSYLNATKTYLDWIVSQPQLDLPETAPKVIDMGDPEALAMPENESLVDISALYEALEVEIANSQSARMATGVISHDEIRIRAIIAKMELFLDNYVSQVQPLDLPESAPLRPQTGPGRSGV